MTERKPLIVLASGGTGGHMLPAVAVARALKAQGAEAVITSDARGLHHGLDAGIETLEVPSSQMLPGLLGKIKTGLVLIRGAIKARGLLGKLQADAVMGFGSYASLPTCFAAKSLGLPLMLHAQDAVLGRANRLLAPHSCLITSNFETMEKVPGDAARHVLKTGNPVRQAIADLRDQPIPQILPDGPIHLLVVGGSQGAAIFAQAVPAALATLPEQTRARLHLSLQVPEAEQQSAAQACAALNLAQADLQPFFADMPERLAKAHLVIARAGATFAELCVAGRAAIYIPLPTAMDDHQSANARALEAAGCGWHLPQSRLDGATLGQHLQDLFDDPSRLNHAAQAARAFQQPGAADRVAQAIREQLD